MLVALEAGAEDIADDGTVWRITTPPTELHAVRTALEEAGMKVDSSELTMLPTATIELDSAESAKKVLRLIDILDENDDVQDVYANFDIPDSILETIDRSEERRVGKEGVSTGRSRWTQCNLK